MGSPETREIVTVRDRGRAPCRHVREFVDRRLLTLGGSWAQALPVTPGTSPVDVSPSTNYTYPHRRLKRYLGDKRCPAGQSMSRYPGVNSASGSRGRSVREGERKMKRKSLFVLMATGLLTVVVVTPAAATHGGPHEQRLPDAACNEGTLSARAGAPGAPFEDPRRRIPHWHTLIIEGQQESGCYHFNEQFPEAIVLS